MRALKRILLVEDEPDIRDFTGMLLETVGGFEVRACATAAEALDVLDAFCPDLVLLDVMLPGMDGPTALRALRRRPLGRNLAVVFFTASSEHAAELLGAGAIDVVPKSIEPMQLCERLRAAWAGGSGAPGLLAGG